MMEFTRKTVSSNDQAVKPICTATEDPLVLSGYSQHCCINILPYVYFLKGKIIIAYDSSDKLIRKKKSWISKIKSFSFI